MWRGAGVCVVLMLVAGPARAQTPAPLPDPTIDTTIDAAEADGDVPKRSIVAFNDYAWRGFSLRWGGGVLLDYSTYSQSEESTAQMALSPLGDLRDFRVLVKGKFPIPGVTYTLGYMYDKAKDTWRFRQTGIMADIPKVHGNLFVGRTKEGFSTNKIMVGYQGWTNERSTISDALIPILADGIKWVGSIPNGKFVYNVGFYKDTRSEIEGFNKNDKQSVGRGVWLPLAGANKGVLHIAVQARHALADDGELQYRSKPESFQAQSYAIDTGRFAAKSSDAFGFETYYRPGPLMFGTEYYVNKVNAPESGNPIFHGGDALVAYILTGETRPYNARGAYFERISPSRSAFDGGRGAWELVARFSYSDMDDKAIHGGRFWRLTPMINWHMSDNFRLEIVYGYGSLNRFNTTGRLQFFQSRIQFQL